MTKHEYNREILIDRVFEKIKKIKRFEKFERKDVAKAIKFSESSIYSEMLNGRGILFREQMSIYPDPGSKAVLKNKRIRMLQKLHNRRNLKMQ